MKRRILCQDSGCLPEFSIGIYAVMEDETLLVFDRFYNKHEESQLDGPWIPILQKCLNGFYAEINRKKKKAIEDEEKKEEERAKKAAKKHLRFSEFFEKKST